MNSLDGILKLVDNELNSMANTGKFRSREDVDMVYKLIDIVKDIHCIWAYEEDEGYSESDGGNSYRGRSYRSYDSGNYNRDGRRRNGYSQMSRNSYRGYSRDSGNYIDDLRTLMDNAPDEQTRQSIQRMIQQMEM